MPTAPQPNPQNPAARGTGLPPGVSAQDANRTKDTIADSRGTGLPPGVSAQDANRTEDTTSAEPTPGMGSQTGRQSLYFGANLPGMLGAAGILVTNPQSLGACGISGVGYAPGSGIPGWLGGPALLGQGFTGGLTPADLSGSVYGFSSILPGYGSTAPGTYLTYRLMRNNPTVAIARLAATAPIRAADITVDGPDATDEQVEFIESIILPLWPAFVRDALFALDYGWKGFEKVYATSGGGGYTVLQRLKPLGVDITMIRWDEATGQMAGLEQQDAKLGPDKCFVWTYDQEDDAYYGRSRHENIRAVWWAWMELLRKEGQYLSKVAGVTPVMKYPEGTGRDATGTVRPNFELAQQALYMLGRGNGIAMPNRLADWAQDMIRAGIDVSQLASWQIQFLEPKGEHGQDFIIQMQHKESLMLRGWLVPERAVAEGKYGTKAEAETHTDLAVAIAQHDLFDLLRCVNERIIDPLLALNFGPEARGLVTVNASPLIDDKAVLARNIVEAVLTSPNNAGLVTKVLNFDAMLEQQGLPVTGVSAAEAMRAQKANAGASDGDAAARGAGDGSGGGSGGAVPSPQMTRTRVFCGIRSPGHSPARGSLSSPTTDAQIAGLARRLLNHREMSRRGAFRGSGGGRGRPRSRSRVYAVAPWRRSGATRLDLAGFDPNQARDQHGRWTDEGDHRGALQDQIKGKLQDILNQAGAYLRQGGAGDSADDLPTALGGETEPRVLEGLVGATQPGVANPVRADTPASKPQEAPASEQGIGNVIDELQHKRLQAQARQRQGGSGNGAGGAKLSPQTEMALEAFLEKYDEDGNALMIWAMSRGYTVTVDPEATSVRLNGSVIVVPGSMDVVVDMVPSEGGVTALHNEVHRSSEEIADALHEELSALVDKEVSDAEVQKEYELLLADDQSWPNWVRAGIIEGLDGFGVKSLDAAFHGSTITGRDLTPGQRAFLALIGSFNLVTTATGAGQIVMKVGDKLVSAAALDRIGAMAMGKLLTQDVLFGAAGKVTGAMARTTAGKAFLSAYARIYNSELNVSIVGDKEPIIVPWDAASTDPHLMGAAPKDTIPGGTAKSAPTPGIPQEPRAPAGTTGEPRPTTGATADSRGPSTTGNSPTAGAGADRPGAVVHDGQSPGGEGRSLGGPNSGVAIIGPKGKLGELDDIVDNAFIENKSATGIAEGVRRRGGSYAKAAEKWAADNIYSTTSGRIKNIGRATATMPEEGLEAIRKVPTIDEVRKVKQFIFRVRETDPELQAAVQKQLARLRAEFPDYKFDVHFGS